jgi:transposase
MSHRYRLYPTPDHEPVLERHCADARFVWNLALEQHGFGREHRDGKWGDKSGLGPRPGPAERQRQLAEARQESWLSEGSSSVQRQALRDFDQALANWRGKTHRRPRWRKKGEDEGFCVRDVTVKRLNRRWATVGVPKAGTVRFRLSRPLPAKSGMARVTLDASGRWYVSFAAAQGAVVRTPTGSVVGIDRGVATTLAISDGTMFRAPTSPKLVAKVVRLDQSLSRQRQGSKHRAKTRRQRARAHAQIADRRRDWVEKTTTQLVVDHDVLVLEDLRVKNMVRRPKPKPDPEKLGAFLPNGASAKARTQPVDPSVVLGHVCPPPSGQGRSEWRHRLFRRSSVYLPAMPAL